MSYRQPRLERLEARLDREAARIDELYRLLEARGIRPQPAEERMGDAIFDEPVQIEGSPLPRRTGTRPVRRRTTRLHVGTATGV